MTGAGCCLKMGLALERCSRVALCGCCENGRALVVREVVDWRSSFLGACVDR